jgi:hypothetical protein
MRTGGSRRSILQHRIADGCKRVSGNPECRKPAVGLHTITKKAGRCKCARKAEEQRNGHQIGERKAARQDQQCGLADNIVLRNQKCPGDVLVIGIQASIRGSCTLANAAATAAMPRSARATANATRRSVGPAGRFARTMSFARARRKDVDGRNKSGHDDFWVVPIKTQQPVAVPRTALRFRGNDE